MTITAAKLAVDGGAPLRTDLWPEWPIWDEREEAAILDVLRSGQWWSVGGKRVPEFEEEFARYHDAKHAVAVTNGTAALEIALRALGIGCGDEVIVPPYTFIATASSVLAASATPVFVDIDPDSLNIDPGKIEAAITPRTKAIIPVHIAGGPADLDGVLEVAKRHGLAVIEDAAQAHGAEWKGRKVGAIGACGTFSFQASKNLNAGEGGVIITDDDETADRLWSVHNVGRTKSGKWYEHNVLGSNFRMTEWQAAILRCQLERLPEQTALRNENAAYLSELLFDVPGVRTLKRDPRITAHAYHLYVFRCDLAVLGGHSRDEFVRALTAEGVPCYSGYVPLYKEKVFDLKASGNGAWCQVGRCIDYRAYAEQCPVCEEVCSDAVWIMQHFLLGTRSDMESIAEAVGKIIRPWA
jgi:dTDP-4-amino-4,6-dideoxygalactose transaminase